MSNVAEDSSQILARERQDKALKAAKAKGTAVAPRPQAATEEAKRKTMRQALTEIYQRMLLAHGPYVKANFPMLSYGMKEGSETMKKACPDTFARYFFRYVKCISDKKGTDIATK